MCFGLTVSYTDWLSQSIGSFGFFEYNWYWPLSVTKVKISVTKISVTKVICLCIFSFHSFTHVNVSHWSLP